MGSLNTESTNQPCNVITTWADKSEQVNFPRRYFVLNPNRVERLSSRCIQQASTKLRAAPTTVLVIRRLLSYRRHNPCPNLKTPILSAKNDSTQFLCILLGQAFLCTCICIQKASARVGSSINPKFCHPQMPHAKATRMSHILQRACRHEQWKRVT